MLSRLVEGSGPIATQASAADIMGNLGIAAVGLFQCLITFSFRRFLRLPLSKENLRYRRSTRSSRRVDVIAMVAPAAKRAEPYQCFIRSEVSLRFGYRFVDMSLVFGLPFASLDIVMAAKSIRMGPLKSLSNPVELNRYYMATRQDTAPSSERAAQKRRQEKNCGIEQ